MRQGIQLLSILLCLQVARIVRNAGTHRGHINLFLPALGTSSSAFRFL